MNIMGELGRTLFSRRWWWVTLIVLVLMAVFARLGFWQLDRLEQRRAANAQLIAAAPEMLAMLQTLLAHGVCRLLDAEDAHQLEQLIAKAKGE